MQVHTAAVLIGAVLALLTFAASAIAAYVSLKNAAALAQLELRVTQMLDARLKDFVSTDTCRAVHSAPAWKARAANAGYSQT